MSEEQAEYNIDQVRRDQAALNQYAALKNASEDTISVNRMYLEMTGYDFPAAMILDELMFWTLPQKKTGKTGLRVRRDGYLWMAVSRMEWLERKGLRPKTADTGIKQLVGMGIIARANFYFNGKPRLHLRIIPAKFFELYGQAMAAKYKDAEIEEAPEKELSELYEMMGISNLPNSNLQNGNGNLPNGNMENLPNGNIINSPDSPDTTLDYICPIAAKLAELKFPFNPNSGIIIQGWKDDFPGRDDVIIRAIEKAHAKSARNLNYIDQIIIGWKRDGVPLTREEQKALPSQARPTQNRQSLPEFQNQLLAWKQTQELQNANA